MFQEDYPLILHNEEKECTRLHCISPLLSHICKLAGIDQKNSVGPTGYAYNIHFSIITSYK